MAENNENTLGAAMEQSTGGNPEEGMRDLMGDFVRELVTGEDPKPPEGKGEGREPSGEAPEPEKPAGESEPPPAKGETPGAEEEEPDLPASTPKATREGWDKLKGEKKKLKGEVAERDKQLAKLTEELKAIREEYESHKGKIAQIPEWEEKVKNQEELEKKIAILAVEESPEYQRAVGKPWAALEAAATSLAKQNDSSVAEFIAAISEPDLEKRRPRLKEIIASWDEDDRQEARNMADAAFVLVNKHAELQQNALEAAKEQKQLAAETAEKAKKQAKADFHKATDHVMEKLKDSVPFLALREGETHDERLAAITEKVKAVDFEAASPNNRAFAAAAAIYLPTVLKMLHSVQEENETLKKRLGDKAGKQPKLKGEHETPTGEQEEEEDFFKAMGIPTNPLISDLVKSRG